MCNIGEGMEMWLPGLEGRGLAKCLIEEAHAEKLAALLTRNPKKQQEQNEVLGNKQELSRGSQ